MFEMASHVDIASHSLEEILLGVDDGVLKWSIEP